jgi:DNA helicase-2/ATP-dependent DNA helicase PcrA
MSRDYVLQPFRPAIDFQIDYAEELNAQQHAAVTAPPGPSLVIAGAGAGKTRTLVYRVAYLLEQGIPAERILLLTFTNKAAREMMERVNELLGSDLTDLWGGTFHSIGYRVLRKHAEKLGWKPRFTIMDREDARDLLKACVADMNIDVKATRFPKTDVLANILSKAVNTGQTIPEILGADYDYFSMLAPQIETLEVNYQERKKAASVMDFDDLLVLWLRLLQENDDVREYYQRKFQFVLVDEYQDTNIIQAQLIDILGERHGNVMVVGDDSQSIYSWRGANFKNILEFPQRYPQAHVYKIETNYRSTPEILDLANAAIKPNLLQFQKDLAPARASGIKPVLVACQDADQQSAFICQRILELREEGVDLNKMAVLYRSHFHALELQLEMTRRNIPFSITSGVRFFEQAHIKDVSAYLKFVCNEDDELSFKRMAQLIQGIGGKGAEKLWRFFREELMAARDASSEEAAGSATPLGTAMQKCQKHAPRKAAKAWSNLAVTVAQLETPETRRQPGLMVELVLDAGYDDYLKETFTNSRSRQEDLEQLAGFAAGFEGIEDFLSQLSLLSNIESESDQSAAQDTEQLKLSTIHQAKGLEFDVVFLIMLCDGLFPSGRSLENPDAEEEERRLFYVALTRARNELYLSFPLVRLAHGRGGDYIQQPSRFLGDLPASMIDEWNLRQ